MPKRQEGNRKSLIMDQLVSFSYESENHFQHMPWVTRMAVTRVTMPIVSVRIVGGDWFSPSRDIEKPFIKSYLDVPQRRGLSWEDRVRFGVQEGSD